MLSGNPDSFAIWCDAVDPWSTGTFKNGCMAFFIGGQLISTTRSTLGVDINSLSKLYCMSYPANDEILFNTPTIEAYAELYERAFPSMDSEAEHNDFSHLVSAESLSDDGYNIFLVESGDLAKLIYGTNNDWATVREAIIARGEFQSVVKTALMKFRTTYP